MAFTRTGEYSPAIGIRKMGSPDREDVLGALGRSPSGVSSSKSITRAGVRSDPWVRRKSTQPAQVGEYWFRFALAQTSYPAGTHCNKT